MNRQTKRAILAALITAGALPVGAKLVSDFPKPAIIGVAKPGLILPKKNPLIPNLASLPLLGAGLGVDAVSGAGPFDVGALTSFVAATMAADNSTYTFPISLGAADSGKKFYIPIYSVKADPAATVTSVKITNIDGGGASGEVTCALVTGTNTTVATGGASHLTEAYEGVFPGSGTTADIQVVFSGTMVRCAGAYSRIVSGTYSSGGVSTSTLSGTLNTGSSLDIPTDGVGICHSYNSASTSYNAWTNLSTEDFDILVETGRTHSGGRRTTAGTTQVTANAPAAGVMTLTWVAYGP